ncbi:hypothetical protein ABLE91_12795 [Aquabacter sp. CN5-332]|uniref:hypothetical protein n=1 Tax=Aquabacter sp. CN5-332 TaxID=3156608 RepID=UPI0032B54989
MVRVPNGMGGGGVARVRLALLLAAALALSGCAGEGVFSMFGPKEPEVPQVPAGQFPSVGAPVPQVERPPVLDAQGQAKMESELEALGKQTQQKGEDAAKDVP